MCANVYTVYILQMLVFLHATPEPFQVRTRRSFFLRVQADGSFDVDDLELISACLEFAIRLFMGLDT